MQMSYIYIGKQVSARVGSCPETRLPDVTLLKLCALASFPGFPPTFLQHNKNYVSRSGRSLNHLTRYPTKYRRAQKQGPQYAELDVQEKCYSNTNQTTRASFILRCTGQNYHLEVVFQPPVLHSAKGRLHECREWPEDNQSPPEVVEHYDCHPLQQTHIRARQYILICEKVYLIRQSYKNDVAIGTSTYQYAL